MNGAQAMIRTLVDAGVTTCFTNPGTSEMHFVAALDSVPEMRGVLGLFEGVATGAADGYARMAGVPACTLLHLGPGLGNGLANLHNARRAKSPMVNIVGDHATYHARFDAPLASDIETAARNVSPWIGRPERTEDLCRVTAEAVAASLQPPGQVATPSNSPSTPRISGTASRAATKCISLVPGFVKHVVTPASTSVRIMASAPFMAFPGHAGRCWPLARWRSLVHICGARP